MRHFIATASSVASGKPHVLIFNHLSLITTFEEFVAGAMSSRSTNKFLARNNTNQCIGRDWDYGWVGDLKNRSVSINQHVYITLGPQ